MKDVTAALALLALVVPRPAAAADGGAPAGLLFGPELDVDSAVLTGATGDQSISAAAWDGEQLLAARRSPLWRSGLRIGRAPPAGVVLRPPRAGLVGLP